MADNASVSSASTLAVAGRVGTYSGDASQIAQAVVPVIATGSDDAKTLTDLTPISAALDSTGTGIQAVGIVAQFDDTSTAAVTENQFASPRISSRRALLVEGVASGTAVAVSLASVPSHAVTNAGTFATQAACAGDVAHDGVDSGNPQKVGARAIAHGTNPTAVAAADRTDLFANRAGVLFVMGGHPNVFTYQIHTTGALTDQAMGPAIGAGLKMVVTQMQVAADNACTAFPAFRAGFGTANTPGNGSTTGQAGVVLSHPGIPAGGGISRGDGSGILGVGADNEELRITCAAPTGGSLDIVMSGYTIES